MYGHQLGAPDTCLVIMAWYSTYDMDPPGKGALQSDTRE